ncbi:hypothetical protein P8452_48776 [Trifolium repens]|jgi:uncharacterized membrane protein YqiK|nr:hypothetical protein P8452_48776 [Trifolium repens]
MDLPCLTVVIAVIIEVIVFLIWICRRIYKAAANPQETVDNPELFQEQEELELSDGAPQPYFSSEEEN